MYFININWGPFVCSTVNICVKSTGIAILTVINIALELMCIFACITGTAIHFRVLLLLNITDQKRLVNG